MLFRSENSSVIMLEFSQSVNMDSVMIEMSGYVDLVKANFDEGVGTPMLMKLNPDMLPVMTVSIDADDMESDNEGAQIEDEEINKVEERTNHIIITLLLDNRRVIII